MSELKGSAAVLVSIGLPTYNRAGTLRRSIASALAQSHRNIELVISDNASTDETEAICREFAAGDPRVRYIRQEKNLGPTPNFLAVLEASRGEYFMWLCDDDWLDPSYIEECVAELMRDSETILVGGIANYYEGNVFQHAGAVTNLLQDDGLSRMLDYYDTIVDNGIFYGLWRRAQVSGLPLDNTMGSDWLTLGAAAYFGKIRTITGARIHRDLGGSTVSFAAIVEQMELPAIQAHFPYITIAVNAVQDILFRVPLFRRLPLTRRLRIATRVFYLIVSKYVVRGAIVRLVVKTREWFRGSRVPSR
jgi:glycosyltransferase involved in cell wall biosynthesis